MLIEVEVKDVTGKFILRNHIGEGSYDGRKLMLSTVIPDGSPVIQLDDKFYIVSIHDLAKAVCEAALDMEDVGNERHSLFHGDDNDTPR